METLRNFYNSLSSTLLFDKHDKKDVLPLGVRTLDGTYVSVGTTYDSLSKAMLKDHLAFKSSPLGVFLEKSSFEQINFDVQELGGSISSLRYVDPVFVPDNGLYILCEGSSFIYEYIQRISNELSDESLIKDSLKLENKNLTFSKDILKVNSEFEAFMSQFSLPTPRIDDSAQSVELKNEISPEDEQSGDLYASANFAYEADYAKASSKIKSVEIIEIGSFNKSSILGTVFSLLMTKNFGKAYDYMKTPYNQDLNIVENDDQKIASDDPLVAVDADSLIREQVDQFTPFTQMMNMLSQGLLVYVDKEQGVMVTTTLNSIFSVAQEPVTSFPMIQRIFASFSKELKVSYQLSVENENMLYNYLSSTPKRPMSQMPDEGDKPKLKP
jgi:hypothetical protein